MTATALTIALTTLHLGRPSASPPSRNVPGTARRNTAPAPSGCKLTPARAKDRFNAVDTYGGRAALKVDLGERLGVAAPAEVRLRADEPHRRHLEERSVRQEEGGEALHHRQVRGARIRGDLHGRAGRLLDRRDPRGQRFGGHCRQADLVRQQVHLALHWRHGGHADGEGREREPAKHVGS